MPCRKSLCHILQKKCMRLPLGPTCVFYCCLAGSLCYVTLKLLYIVFGDRCGGVAFINALCSEYYRGNVAGNLCYSMCRERTPVLSYCDGDQHGYRHFKPNSTQLVKVKLSQIHQLQLGTGLGSVYSFPPDGMEREEFGSYVTDVLQEVFGYGPADQLYPHVMEYADSNKDGKLSLAEARSIWSLMNHPDFLLLLIFEDSAHFPGLLGSCGGVIMTQLPRHRQLFPHADSFPLFSRVFPQWVTWFYPPWHERAKIVLSLLEYIMDSYQRANYGAFHLCNASHLTLGVGEKSDIKILDLYQIKTPSQLVQELAHILCFKDEDCAYSSQCVMRCDVSTHSCTSELTRPSLSYVCTYVRTYILKDAPKKIKGDLAHAIEKCENLSIYQADMNLKYSVVYSDLKSLLWGQISYVRN